MMATPEQALSGELSAAARCLGSWRAIGSARQHPLHSPALELPAVPGSQLLMQSFSLNKWPPSLDMGGAQEGGHQRGTPKGRGSSGAETATTGTVTMRPAA